jgi:acetoin utilization protein AcuB
MLMTPAPATAAADDSLLDAAARMSDRGVRHLPVVDGDRRIIGMLSDRDVRTAVGDVARGADTSLGRGLRVADVMTRDAYVVGQNAPFADLVQLFIDQRIGAVPVVDERGHLVGIISYVDVLRNAGAL